MFKLLDKTFWRFASGFVLILVVSVSLLTLFGMYENTKENVAALFRAISVEEDI